MTLIDFQNLSAGDLIRLDKRTIFNPSGFEVGGVYTLKYDPDLLLGTVTLQGKEEGEESFAHYSRCTWMSKPERNLPEWF